jgi:hypothetical protein
MAFKMNRGASPNFKDLGSSGLTKKKKSLGTREDNINKQNPDGSNPTVDTLTTTNTRTGKQKTKDISKGRADRIRRRQNRKNPPAEPKAESKASKTTEPAKKSGPNWDEAPAVGSPERAAWYKENNLAPDKTIQTPKKAPTKGWPDDLKSGDSKQNSPDYSSEYKSKMKN